MYFSDSDPLVQGNLITGNYCEEGGAGVWSERGSLKLYGNIISKNDSIMLPGGVKSSGNIEAIDNEIFGNGYGGIYLDAGYHKIIGNRIHHNDDFYGIWCREGRGVIANNVVYENEGIGIELDYVFPDLFVVNNTISGNLGGGIRCDFYSSPVITNTIVFGNTPPQIHLISGSPTVTYCNVEGGWPGTGNIDADPGFVDKNQQDVHILHSSPCRDGGDPTTPSFTEEDFEGDPRTAFGTVDIGADEFYPHIYQSGTAIPGGSVDLMIIGLPGAAPVGFWIAFDVFKNPIPGAFGEWFLLPPVVGPVLLVPIPSDGVLVVPGTLPLSPLGPYKLYLQAIMGTPLGLTNLLIIPVE